MTLKPRQERFCRLFVECANAAQAARAAGYRPESARNTGHRLLKLPGIIQRIGELHTRIADGQCRDVDALLSKLETVYCRAIDQHQLGAAARAIELQAKLGGVAATTRTPRALHRKGAQPSVDEEAISADPGEGRDAD